jgi:hypothetical protein
VRQQITQGLVKQRNDILRAALVEVAMSEAKIVNNLASSMLDNPSNLGLRPASQGAGTATPANRPAATPAATQQKPASPAASPVASPKK